MELWTKPFGPYSISKVIDFFLRLDGRFHYIDDDGVVCNHFINISNHKGSVQL